MEEVVLDIKTRIDKVKLQLANKSNNVEPDQPIVQKRITSDWTQRSIHSALANDALPNQYANGNSSLVDTLRQRIAEARTKLQLIK